MTKFIFLSLAAQYKEHCSIACLNVMYSTWLAGGVGGQMAHCSNWSIVWATTSSSWQLTCYNPWLYYCTSYLRSEHQIERQTHKLHSGERVSLSDKILAITNCTLMDLSAVYMSITWGAQQALVAEVFGFGPLHGIE